MATFTSKVAESVTGKFYVDSQCIDCDLCRQTAPDNFDRSDNGYSFVKKQPVSPEEETLCQQALSECPVEAIGSDGH